MRRRRRAEVGDVTEIEPVESKPSKKRKTRPMKEVAVSRKAVARRLVRLARMLAAEDGWPKKVEKGGLREKMGLKEDQPLEEQTSPSAVAKFFQETDEEGRGMVTFAMNSNQDSSFWKKVADMIEKESKAKEKEEKKESSVAEALVGLAEELLGM